MKNNVVWACKSRLKIYGDHAQFDEKNNFETAEDPGFVDMAKMNFQLKDDSVVYKKVPGFQKIPFKKIGLFKDVFRVELR